MPPGYNSKGAIRMLAKQQTSTWLGVSGEKIRESMEEGDTGAVNYDEVRQKLRTGLRKVQQNLQVIAGTPTTVIPKIKSILSVLRPGVFIMFSIQGPVGNDDRRNSMRLFAQDVMPALKEHAKAIDLPDPFQRTPGSVKLAAGTARGPVSDRSPLAALGLR
jgi:hypothetical protein